MSTEVRVCRDKAERCRKEADEISSTQAPNGMIGMSYLAVYHAAMAALLAAHGTSPTKHGKLHDALARLAEQREVPAKAHEIHEAVERMNTMRVRANYDPSVRPEETRADAERIPALRDTVIAFCDRVIDGA